MLKQLHIENLAIISSCDIPFHSGMTVLTGETGAGKSIVVDAIGLLLGRPGSDDWIKSDADTALVQAVFQVTTSELSEELQSFIEESDTVIVTRKLTRGKASTARINGQLVPLKLLKALLSPLITIIGQHEHMNLLDSPAQRHLLDAFGDKKYRDILASYTRAYKEYETLKSDYTALKKKADDQASRSEFLKFQLDDISKHSFLRGEEDALVEQKKQLKLSEKRKNLSSNVIQASSALSDYSKQLETSLSELQTHFPDIQSVYDKVMDLSQRVTDVSFEIQKSLRGLEKSATLDPDALEERLDVIFRYKQKYRVNHLDLLCDFVENSSQELSDLSVVDQSLAQLQKQVDESFSTLVTLGESVHQHRLLLAKAIQKKVEQIMQKLNFSYVAFRVLVQKTDGKWTESGGDDVSFLISTNAGEPPKPISKIASGGELSRIMLAIRVVFCDVNMKETMIFDEVDSGIGGLTANTVGELLKTLSNYSQVICVTHLPQVAQFSTQHIVVEKKMEKGKTITQLRFLLPEQKDLELRRMVGGESVIERLSGNLT